MFFQDHTTYIMGVVIICSFYFPCILITHLYSWHISFTQQLEKSIREERDNLEISSSRTKSKRGSYNIRYFSTFLIPFTVFVWFQISHLYQLVLAYGGSFMFFTSPIAIFTVVVPLSMLLHGTHCYFKSKYYYELVPGGQAGDNLMVASCTNYSTATTLPENRNLPEMSSDEDELDVVDGQILMESPHLPPCRTQFENNNIDEDETPLIN